MNLGQNMDNKFTKKVEEDNVLLKSPITHTHHKR